MIGGEEENAGCVDFAVLELMNLSCDARQLISLWHTLSK